MTIKQNKQSLKTQNRHKRNNKEPNFKRNTSKNKHNFEKLAITNEIYCGSSIQNALNNDIKIEPYITVKQQSYTNPTRYRKVINQSQIKEINEIRKEQKHRFLTKHLRPTTPISLPLSVSLSLSLSLSPSLFFPPISEFHFTISSSFGSSISLLLDSDQYSAISLGYLLRG